MQSLVFGISGFGFRDLGVGFKGKHLGEVVVEGRDAVLHGVEQARSLHRHPPRCFRHLRVRAQ